MRDECLACLCRQEVCPGCIRVRLQLPVMAEGPGIEKLFTWELSPLFSVEICDLLGVELHVRKGARQELQALHSLSGCGPPGRGVY